MGPGDKLKIVATSTLYSPATVLHQRAAAVRAVIDMDDNVFTRALRSIERAADELAIPIAIVGGLASIHHGARVTTLDIDLVVGRDDADRLLAVVPREGLALRRRSERGWHALAYEDEGGSVDIHIVPVGERSPRDPEYAPVTPPPAELGVDRGVGYANFASWVMLKLVANREKDRYHLIESLQHADQVQISQAVEKLRPLHPSYLRELERLLRAAEDERQENW